MVAVHLRARVGTPRNRAVVHKHDLGTNVKNMRLAEKLSDRYRAQLDDIRRRRRGLGDADLLVALEEEEMRILAKMEGA